ncbi:winged helix-turn-helix domain-containing protein [Nocardioides sp. zg-1228]|uniref:winged helix-turn-helix domain-containing protein n=1 Tax=Nocardioides sp. zg-1228 TaxID=2763008 RepID=UPI001642C7D1|nr:winged helix-turn-helix domain-containing protein [Nocardioides sp. zg-1228]MBC2933760.1 winged helix-turn-helix transcriptional regulator [Nocardioides sp. zg-1228]QSF58536.1 winged helix-turn-helix transcriptional regulator [Nocardioides sp. zg-1228]
MIVAELDAATASRVRLAPSPAAEAMAWLRLAVAGRRDTLVGRPRLAGPLSRDVDVQLLVALVAGGTSGYLPDFLTPKPGTADALDAQLAQVAATPDDEARHQVLTETFADGPAPAAVVRAIESGTMAVRAARGLESLWRHAVGEVWGAFGHLVEADIARLSAVQGRSGVTAMLETLHPHVTYDGSCLRVWMPPWEEAGVLRGTELVVSPALLDRPHVSPQLCRPDQAVLRYPVRTLGDPIATVRRRALGRLMGDTRVALLYDLATPRCTATLSERHRLSAATVSYHLGILHECGLVTRVRHGNVVDYQRSGRAEALLRRPEVTLG